MAVEDVYRRGAKDVHHAFRAGGVVYEHPPCRLDGKGEEYVTEPPDGPRCDVCFAGLGDEHLVSGHGAVPPRNTRPRLPAYALASGALALAFLGGVWASPDQRPMISYTASTVPSTTLPTAAPSATAGIPSQTPAPTSSTNPAPTLEVRVIERRIVVIVRPEPADAFASAHPVPTPKPCIHPGNHVGVDPCRWPHN